MANECRACAGTLGQAGLRGGRPQRRPGSLPGPPAAAPVQEHRRASPERPAGRREHRPGPDQVRLRARQRRTHRNDALLVSLALQPDGRHPPSLPPGRGRRRPGRLLRRSVCRSRTALPAAPGRARRAGVSPAGCSEQAPPRTPIALGSPAPVRRPDRPGRVGLARPSLRAEPVQTAHRDHGAPGRGDAERGMLRPPPATRQVVGDVPRGDLAGLGVRERPRRGVPAAGRAGTPPACGRPRRARRQVVQLAGGRRVPLAHRRVRRRGRVRPAPRPPSSSVTTPSRGPSPPARR